MPLLSALHIYIQKGVTPSSTLTTLRLRRLASLGRGGRGDGGGERGRKVRIDLAARSGGEIGRCKTESLKLMGASGFFYRICGNV